MLVRPNLIEHLPAGGAAIGAAAVGLAFVALPTAWLNAGIDASGVAAVLSIAATPLGAGARAVLALGSGALIAAVAWSALTILFGAGGVLAPRAASKDGVPAVRRADAHPDAPPRRPLSAADLVGSAGYAMPSDRLAPINAVEAGSTPPVAREQVRPLSSGERIRIVALGQPVSAGASVGGEIHDIESLMRRLSGGSAAI